MKTEDLKALGLTDEQINTIMAENGKDIKREQDKYSKLEIERDNYKSQLETAQTTLKEFEGIDVKDLQGKISTLSADLDKKDKEYQGKITEMEFNSVLENAITSVGAKNSKAVKALLDIEALKSSKNQEADIKAAIEACQKDNDYLFGATEPINNPIAATGKGIQGADTNTTTLRAAMGLGEIKK